MAIRSSLVVISILTMVSILRAEEAILVPMLNVEKVQEAQKALPTFTERAKQPVRAVGLKVIDLAPGDTQARKVGIHVGDTITHMEGSVLRSRDQLNGRTKECQLTLCSSGGSTRTVLVKPGIIGVNHRLHWDLEGWYVKEGHHHDAWNDLVLVALHNLHAKPELAATAWAMAFEAGYEEDFLSSWCRGYLAFMLGLPFEPEEWESPQSQVFTINERYLFAVSRGQLAKMDALVNGGLRNIDGKVTTSNLVTSYGAELVVPSSRQEWKRGALLDEQMTEVTGYIAGNSLSASSAKLLVSNPNFNIMRPEGHYAQVAVSSEGMRDVNISATFDLEPSPGSSKWAKTVRFALLDLDRRVVFSSGNLPEGSVILEVGLEADQQFMLGHSGMESSFRLPWLDPQHSGGRARHHLELTVCGEWAEARLDGVCLALVPVRRSINHIGLYVQIVGVSARFGPIDVYEVIPASPSED